VRKTHHKVKQRTFLKACARRYHAGEHILAIAQNVKMDGKVSFSPVMMARLMLGELLNASKAEISQFIKHVSLIEDRKLQSQVYACIEADFHYSPHSNRLRKYAVDSTNPDYYYACVRLFCCFFIY
jgi:hypothetical protein